MLNMTSPPVSASFLEAWIAKVDLTPLDDADMTPISPVENPPVPWLTAVQHMKAMHAAIITKLNLPSFLM